ncbi:DUF6537 domain-containing protein [Paraburkholderia sp.]|uniref:DUF6537 domain-containing protein n=1 Tax=Paraburkholderia sp. TaxID=1926495 RepID=UPI003C7A9CDE
MADCRESVEAMLDNLNKPNLTHAVELASWLERVRGFGRVKDTSVAAVRAQGNIA